LYNPLFYRRIGAEKGRYTLSVKGVDYEERCREWVCVTHRLKCKARM
jgi:hypothetical protein